MLSCGLIQQGDVRFAWEDVRVYLQSKLSRQIQEGERLDWKLLAETEVSTEGRALVFERTIEFIELGPT